MKFAKVNEYGKVVDYQVFPETHDPSRLVNPGILAGYRPCPDEVGTGWTFDGTSWSAPPAPGQAKGYLEKLRQVQARHQPTLDTLIAAHATATMLDDGEDAASIRAEYATALADMEREMATITAERRQS